jgi:hypothetical protein
VRDTTVESLGGLRPAFDKAGNITAGNASQISDGGSAVIVASKAAAEKLGTKPLAEIVGFGQVAGPDASLLNQPSRAILKALEKAGKSVSDVDLFELNEAFAAVGIASMKELGISADITNVNGGAIAIGHPLGMSGTRVSLTLALELARRGGGLGAAALCGGGGQGDAILLRSDPEPSAFIRPRPPNTHIRARAPVPPGRPSPPQTGAGPRTCSWRRSHATSHPADARTSPSPSFSRRSPGHQPPGDARTWCRGGRAVPASRQGQGTATSQAAAWRFPREGERVVRDPCPKGASYGCIVGRRPASVAAVRRRRPGVRR